MDGPELNCSGRFLIRYQTKYQTDGTDAFVFAGKGYPGLRDIFVEYKKSGYSKKFYAEHESELVMYKAAREAFNQLPEKKIPKIRGNR